MRERNWCRGSAFGCSAIWLAIGACRAEEPAATPYRPTASSPAALSEHGWLELEAGGQYIKDRGARRDSVPYTVKLACSRNWGVRFGGQAAIWQREDDSAKCSGCGDTSIIGKYRIPINTTSAFGIEAGLKSPTARCTLESGKADASLNLIYSAHIADYYLDTNLARTRLGAFEPGQGRLQTVWAAAVSHPLTETPGLASELSTTTQKGARSTSQALVAMSKRTVLDNGLARGLVSAAPDGIWPSV